MSKLNRTTIVFKDKELLKSIKHMLIEKEITLGEYLENLAKKDMDQAVKNNSVLNDQYDNTEVDENESVFE